MAKVVLSHALYKDGMEALQGKAQTVITDNGNSDEIIGELSDADAFILRIGKIDRSAMMASRRLKVIARPGVGVDSIDMAAATELGIPVVIAPGCNTRSVAEHALALMFATAKNLVDSDIETRKGNFQVREKYAAVELYGRTAGIVGFGNIGREVARLCTALGLKVCAYDPFVPNSVIEQAGYGYFTELAELLAASDLVSLHIPLTPETRGIIGVSQLQLMKPSAFLINCSRGGLIDEDALYTALQSGQIAGAGLDVLEVEPMQAGHPLFALSSVVVTPHLAAQTREATARGVTMAVEGTLAVLQGVKWPHVANKEVYEHPRWR